MTPHTLSRATAIVRWLRRRAENIAALLLLAMFLCFILQIAARYVFNYPLGWTDEARDGRRQLDPDGVRGGL